MIIVIEKTDKFNFITIKTSIYEDTIKKVKRQATNWEKILGKLVTDDLFGFKIYEELKFSKKNSNNPIEKWTKDRHFTEMEL